MTAESVIEPLDFACPRCHQPASARLYGPCASCRRELQASLRREGRTIDVAGYEPKMNVTPNQVATKE